MAFIQVGVCNKEPNEESKLIIIPLINKNRFFKEVIMPK